MQQPGSWRPWKQQRAPGWAVLGAVLGLLLAGLVAVPGCLNPRPEEDPSALELADPADPTDVSADDAPGAQDIDRESCDDNPLLGGCEPSPSPGANVGAPPPASEEEPAAPADAGAPSVGDAGGVDAGAAAAPAGSPLAE